MSEKETNMFLEQEQDPIDKTIVTRKMSEYAINDAINPEIEQNSIEQGSKYGEILYDKSLVFHGIGFDLIKLHSILENGILSEQAAQSKGVELIRNNDGFNLNDSVSVVESPSINNTFTFGCFESYIKSGISFVIENGEPYKATAGSSRDSSFLDESYIRYGISKKNIVGVMVPVDLLDSSLKDLPPAHEQIAPGRVADCYKKMVSALETETGYTADVVALDELIAKDENDLRTLDYMDYREKRESTFDQMGKVMSKYVEQAYSKKLGIDRPTLKDVLKLYLPESMKVYNSDGFSITI